MTRCWLSYMPFSYKYTMRNWLKQTKINFWKILFLKCQRSSSSKCRIINLNARKSKWKESQHLEKKYMDIALIIIMKTANYVYFITRLFFRLFKRGERNENHEKFICRWQWCEVVWRVPKLKKKWNPNTFLYLIIVYSFNNFVNMIFS